MDSLLTQLSTKASPTPVALPEGWALTNGVLVPSGRTQTVIATGSAYSLTNTAAALVFGTTSPSLVLDRAGTWFLSAWVNLLRNAATVVAETVTVKLRRTNNTPADLTGAGFTLTPTASTTASTTLGVHTLPGVVVTTTNRDDIIAIFGNVSATLGAGTIDAIAANIVAIKLF